MTPGFCHNAALGLQLQPAQGQNTLRAHDLFQEEYPCRKLLTRPNEINFKGFCLAEIPPSADPVRVMKYCRALWLAYQGLL